MTMDSKELNLRPLSARDGPANYSTPIEYVEVVQDSLRTGILRSYTLAELQAVEANIQKAYSLLPDVESELHEDNIQQVLVEIVTLQDLKEGEKTVAQAQVQAQEYIATMVGTYGPSMNPSAYISKVKNVLDTAATLPAETLDLIAENVKAAYLQIDPNHFPEDPVKRHVRNTKLKLEQNFDDYFNVTMDNVAIKLNINKRRYELKIDYELNGLLEDLLKNYNSKESPSPETSKNAYRVPKIWEPEADFSLASLLTKEENAKEKKIKKLYSSDHDSNGGVAELYYSSYINAKAPSIQKPKAVVINDPTIKILEENRTAQLRARSQAPASYLPSSYGVASSSPAIAKPKGKDTLPIKGSWTDQLAGRKSADSLEQKIEKTPEAPKRSFFGGLRKAAVAATVALGLGALVNGYTSPSNTYSADLSTPPAVSVVIPPVAQVNEIKKGTSYVPKAELAQPKPEPTPVKAAEPKKADSFLGSFRNRHSKIAEMKAQKQNQLIVQAGDTIWELCGKDPACVTEVQGNNPQIGDLNKIHPGDLVHLTPDPAVEYHSGILENYNRKFWK